MCLANHASPSGPNVKIKTSQSNMWHYCGHPLTFFIYRLREKEQATTVGGKGEITQSDNKLTHLKATQTTHAAR